MPSPSFRIVSNKEALYIKGNKIMKNSTIEYFEKYISMNSFGCKWFFDDETISVPDEVLKNIKPLSKKYSCFLWEKYISKKHRHLMQLGNNEWSAQLSLDNFNWQKDWNENRFEDLGRYLTMKISYSKSDNIIFFWMKECAVETKWNIFLDYWINFLFENEGPIIINFKNYDSISFGPNGALFIGKRRPI